ncbi:DUF3788 family protein [Microbacter margulisiae]|uniref:DUF3788 domain-containing protein n=1 Tax=Microbacter margulisiae TaxID=1350067 RepID=A0A7W5DQN5_9PORP|nr:DUF3788 family protein [Microbacter margulisiae]MBB3187297.1 hypothetical protein [Microbacter margulisiae]
MSKGFFVDKNVKPDDTDLKDVLGEVGSQWNFLLHHLTTNLYLKGDFKFYGVNYGWALRFTKNGKSIIALYPDKNRFTVQIILNGHQVEYALMQDISKQTSNLIRDTELIHEGKWIYLSVNKSTDLRDIEKLIDIRLRVE